MKHALQKLAFMLTLSGIASAGTPADPVIETPPASSGWEFRIEPYGWLTGLDGRTGVGPLVAGIDQSFSDIFDNLDMAAALQFEARNGRWGIIADGFYAEIRKYWPALPDGSLAPGYAGIRPKIAGPHDLAPDFRIDGPAEHGVPGLVNLLGIESPGLTSSLAIAAETMRRIDGDIPRDVAARR